MKFFIVYRYVFVQEPRSCGSEVLPVQQEAMGQQVDACCKNGAELCGKLYSDQLKKICLRILVGG